MISLCTHFFHYPSLSLARFDSVTEGKIDISELCIGCGDISVVAEHPLFEGGYCTECKVGDA